MLTLNYFALEVGVMYGKILMKVCCQMKMYIVPNLNRVLYEWK